jgi:hypothetical protein
MTAIFVRTSVLLILNMLKVVVSFITGILIARGLGRKNTARFLF